MPADDLDEEQFRQPVEDDLAAGPLVARLLGGEADELVEQPGRRSRRTAPESNEAWQGIQQRIERTRVASEEAANQLGVVRTIVTGTIVAGPQRERQGVGVLRPAVNLPVRFGAHARRA